MASIIYSSPRGSFSLKQGGGGFRRSATKKSRNVSVSCLSSLKLSRDIVQKERQRNQYRGGAGRAAATTTQQQFQGQSKEQENSAFMSDEEIKAQLLESDDTAESNDVEWQIPADNIEDFCSKPAVKQAVKQLQEHIDAERRVYKDMEKVSLEHGFDLGSFIEHELLQDQIMMQKGKEENDDIEESTE